MFCLPYLSHTIIRIIRQQAIKTEVKNRILQGLSDEELVTLVFHNSYVDHQLTWKEEHEFLFEGQMYDVVKSWSDQDSVYYQCWPDQKESEVRQSWLCQYKEVSDRDPQKQQHKNRVLEFEKSLFYTPVGPGFLFFRGDEIEIALFTESFWNEIFSTPDYPPPQV